MYQELTIPVSLKKPWSSTDAENVMWLSERGAKGGRRPWRVSAPVNLFNHNNHHS